MCWYELYESKGAKGTETIYTCATEKYLLDYIAQYNGDYNLGVDVWENQSNPELIQSFNIVTCGDCGYPLIHPVDTIKDELTCSQCGFNEELCWFPDYNKE